MSDTPTPPVVEEMPESVASEVLTASICDGEVLDAEMFTARTVNWLANALQSSQQRAEQWLTLPDEQAWWWHWDGEDLTVPHIVNILASHTANPPRYFIAYPDSRWCDEVGGFWLKVQYPNVPSREEQRSLRARSTQRTET